MSKYINLDEATDLLRGIDATMAGEFVADLLESLPTIEVSEEDELKFYYVESIDDYWIGKRSDNFYYAEWRGDYFVWTHSRYLPWGEHIVDENTLWKEHTYPSEPIEISFSEWIVGFMKKHGSKVSEDAISRADAIKAFTLNSKGERIPFVDCDNFPVEFPLRYIVDTLAALPPADKPQGEWIAKDGVFYCSRCDNDSGLSEEDVDLYEMSLPNYCQDCGAKMKGERR